MYWPQNDFLVQSYWAKVYIHITYFECKQININSIMQSSKEYMIRIYEHLLRDSHTFNILSVQTNSNGKMHLWFNCEMFQQERRVLMHIVSTQHFLYHITIKKSPNS